MTRTICIYHANCADGFTAAWAVRQAIGTTAEFIPAGYGSAPPDVAGADVIIVDFSYPRPVIDQMAKSARSILILDHHKTAQENLSGLPEPGLDTDPLDWDGLVRASRQSPECNVFAIFDMDRSGAQIAWDFFHDSARPELVDYVADRDLWQWRLPASREINAVIGSHEMTWITWTNLNRRLITDFGRRLLAAHGVAILRAHDRLVRQVIDTSRREMVIGGHRVPVAAAPYALASDVAGTMAEGAPFAATYLDGPTGRAFSLRSRDGGLDVAQIAATYGGGGHRNASGFKAATGWEGDE